MNGLVGPILVMVWKDILLELRSRDLVVSVLVFGLLVVVVFNFALNNAPGRAEELAPGQMCQLPTGVLHHLDEEDAIVTHHRPVHLAHLVGGHTWDVSGVLILVPRRITLSYSH